MRKFVLWAVCGAGMLLAGCGDRNRYRDAALDFDLTAEELEERLNEIIGCYGGCDSVHTVDRAHARYLCDGTFDRIDALDERLRTCLNDLYDSCPRALIPQLAERIHRYLELCAKANAAEIPFIYKRFPKNPELFPPQLSEPIRPC